jgi:hypothetical protein
MDANNRGGLSKNDPKMTNYKNKISPKPDPQKKCDKKTKLQKKCVDTFALTGAT